MSIPPAEILCAAKAASGDWADFSGLSDKDRSISADVVRDLMLGRHFASDVHSQIRNADPRYTVDSESAPVPITPAGIRIRGAIIKGVIDLTGCVGAGGGFLPGLSLEDCRLEPPDDHQAVLDVSGACLARLSLKGSRFQHVLGRGVRIHGGLDLSFVEPLEGWTDRPWPSVDIEAFRDAMQADSIALRTWFQTEDLTVPRPKSTFCLLRPEAADQSRPCCWLDLSGCQIGAEVTLFGAKLRAPSIGTAGPTDRMNSYYALRLDRAIVEGSLDARGEAILDGGLNLHLATVRGEVWLGGARLMQAESSALDAGGSVLGGIYAIGSPLRTHGGINIAGARIEGHIVLSCADLDGAGKAALRAESLSVQGDMRLLNHTAALGRIVMSNARIEGVFDLTSSMLHGDYLMSNGSDDRIGNALDATSMSVRGGASFTNAMISGTIWMYGADIGEILDLSGATILGGVPENGEQYHMREPKSAEAGSGSRGRKGSGQIACAFSGTDLDVGDSILIGEGFVAFGGFYLQRARVRKDVVVIDAKIAVEEERNNAIDFGWSHILGNLRLEDNRFRGRIHAPHLRAAILSDNEKGYWGASELELDGFRYDSLYECDLSAGKETSVGCVASRIGWLERMPHYQPQPYAHLVDVLISQGRTDEARAILVTKRDKELDRSWGEIWTAGPVNASVAMSMYLASRVFGSLFGYGLSPSRAIGTLLWAFLIGWAFFGWANHRGAMVIDQQAVAGAVLGGQIGSPLSSDPVKTDVPCDRSIRASLYALDVFIPLVDLRQETKCEIGIAENAKNLFQGIPLIGGWRWGAEVEVYRYLKAIYALAGWVIISLSILTFSGLLQRVEGR